MSATLTVHRAGPAMTVQDLGRPGNMSSGLSTGGAADRLALLEAAALLNLPEVVPAIEMAGTGGSFSVDAPMRFALTGAPMRVTLDGAPRPWNASVLLHPGQRLELGGVSAGVYGYLTPAGGIQTERWLGSRAAHLVAGIGKPMVAGDDLPLGSDPHPEAAGQTVEVDDRFSGGVVRLMPGPQTSLFSEEAIARVQATAFRRGAQANRQGIRLDHDGAPFSAEAAAGLASDFILPGDVQMAGEGIPFVLTAECQTIGGYPRLGTIVPDDLPRMAQAPLVSTVRLKLVSLEVADALWRSDGARLRDLRGRVQPLVRDPRYIHDLLSYQLISGATAGDDLDREET